MHHPVIPGLDVLQTDAADHALPHRVYISELSESSTTNMSCSVSDCLSLRLTVDYSKKRLLVATILVLSSTY